MPGGKPSGLFFEFVQRDVSDKLLERVARLGRQAFFRDRTFLGLYGEKEREYRSGKVTPLLDDALMRRVQDLLEPAALWDISEDLLGEVEAAMLAHAAGAR